MMSRRRQATPTQGRRCATTEPGSPLTATLPTSSPRTSPAPVVRNNLCSGRSVWQDRRPGSFSPGVRAIDAPMFVKRFIRKFLRAGRFPSRGSPWRAPRRQRSGLPPSEHGVFGELVVTEKVAHSHRLVTVRARRSRAKAPAPGIAVVAALFSEIASVTGGAFVDGAGASHHRLERGLAPRPPSGLAAAGRAEALASLGLEGQAADRADGRRVVVVGGGHGGKR